MSYNPGGGGGGSGTVTSVSGTGTVSGLTLTGTVTSAGSITLGGTLSTTSASISNFNSASRAQTEAMLVAGSGVTLTPGSSGATRTLTVAAASGGLTFTEVEKNLGAAKTGGKFTIAGTGMTTGKPVLINQAVGPYTGKGTRADEAEMDQVSVSASVTSATVITAYWSSPRRVRGNFKFNYAVGA